MWFEPITPSRNARITLSSWLTSSGSNLVIVGLAYDTNTPVNPRASLVTVSPPRTVVVSRPTVAISGSYPVGFAFSFKSVANSAVVYYLECTTNPPTPSTWSTIAVTPGNGGTASLSDPSPSDSRRFYRIRVQ